MAKLSETYLINEDLLKLYSNISRNVGVDKVYPYISLAQPFYINPVLGDNLVAELVEQIDNDELTNENKALIIKIAPALSLWTDYLALRSMAYTITQKGITKEASENSTSLTEKELAEWKLEIKNNAEKATELLVMFLCKCADSYPLWEPSFECNCEKYSGENTGTTQHPIKTLFYFPNKKTPCGCE